MNPTLVAFIYAQSVSTVYFSTVCREESDLLGFAFRPGLPCLRTIHMLHGQLFRCGLLACREFL